MRKVIIAEDDLMIANMFAEIVVGAGYDLCGIARTVDHAIELGLSQKPHLAVLDLRLADGRAGTEVAARLVALGNLGILYTTGNMCRFMLTSADGHGLPAQALHTRRTLAQSGNCRGYRCRQSRVAAFSTRFPGAPVDAYARSGPVVPAVRARHSVQAETGLASAAKSLQGADACLEIGTVTRAAAFVASPNEATAVRDGGIAGPHPAPRIVGSGQRSFPSTGIRPIS